MSIDIKPNPASAGGVTGGLVYKGSYNANTNTPDLTSSTKGDFYIVSVAGTLAGVSLNVGDHIVFNQDASSPITSAMFDVIDNTDAVSSVNGQTGPVVLDLQDINDVNASLTPTDGVFLVGDGSEWIGESGATARTSLGLGTSATLDTGTSNGNVVVLDAVGLPAVDGSQLTNITVSGALLATNNLSDLNNAGTARTNLGLGTAATKDTGTANGNVVVLDATGLPAVDGSQLTGVTGTDSTKLAIANNLSDLNNVATARTNLGLGTAATQDVGTGANNVVQLDASSRLPAVDGSQLTNISPTGALLIANNLSDLNNAGTARTNLGLGTAATQDVGTANGNVVQLDATGLPAVDGSQLTNVTGTDSTKLAIANNLSDLNNVATARTNLGLGTAATQDVGTGANNVVQLDGSSRLPAVDGSQLTNVPATETDTLDDVVGRGATTATSIQTGGLTVTGDIDPNADATYNIGDENTRFISYYGDMNGAIRFKAKNDSGGQLTKGQVVYIKGVSGTVPTVDKARANSSATMPAFGLVFANANDQAEVQVITFGNLNDFNTSTFSAGDTVFVSSATAGALVNTAPTGESNLIQNIGRVVRSDASAGIIKVGGAGRTNATPNLDQNKIFLGNASNQAVSTALSSIALSGFNNDAFLEISNNLSDLNNASTARTNLGLGTAATKDTGTSNGNVVVLDAVGLPAVDGSQLTNLPGGSAPTVTSASPSTDYTISTHAGNEEIYILTPSADINVNLPAASTCGSGYKYHIKNMASANTLTIDPNSTETIDGSTTFVISNQYEAITIITNGTNWFII